MAKDHQEWFRQAKNTGLEPPDDMAAFIDTLNRISIVTRYPDNLRDMTQTFSKTKTRSIMEHSEKAPQWLKQQQ